VTPVFARLEHGKKPLISISFESYVREAPIRLEFALVLKLGIDDLIVGALRRSVSAPAGDEDDVGMWLVMRSTTDRVWVLGRASPQACVAAITKTD
jgi:hypothetical protein